MSQTSATTPEFERFRATFFEECAEILPDLDERLSSLQLGEVDKETLNAIFRAVHSIKAGAAAFNFKALVEFAHVFETLLDRLRDDRIQQTETVFNVTIRAGDVLAELVEAARSGHDVSQDLTSGVASELKELLEGQQETITVAPAAPVRPIPVRNEAVKTFKIVFEPHQELFRHANEPLLIIRELKRLGELSVTCGTATLPALVELDPEDSYLSFTFILTTKSDAAAVAEVFEFVDQDCSLTIEREGDVEETVDADPIEIPVEATKTFPTLSKTNQEAPASPKTAAAVMASKGVTSIRVDLTRVDRLVNMVGELVITQAMLAQQLSDQSGGQRQQWITGSEELAAHTRELQECVMAIRMQPVKSVFARMPRLVRDISSKLGKQVRLVTFGDQTEVDKTVIEELADPITHMIRNSIDHGVESADVRLAAGKSEMATIELSATQRGGNILITISDDGAGINRQKVLQNAIAKGLVRDDAKLSEDEIHNLIFAPGFTTASEVTELSGRGVGMDVVRRNIANIGGRIQIQSTPGKGTRFTLVIPLTLAVLDGMLVAVGKEKYILPLSSIVESIRPDERSVRSISGGSQVVTVRGEFIRLIPLHRVLSVPDAIPEPWKALVVVVETENGSKAGIVVDELIGQQQVVVKSLTENAEPIPGISGATILGNGRVALILDIDGICTMPDRSSQFNCGEGLSLPPLLQGAGISTNLMGAAQL